ncbi:MAG: AsmA-like C-terminal region-containing protein [Bacteroidota bacterium]
MKRAFRIFGIILGTLFVLLLFLILTPFIFKDKLEQVVKHTANKTLNTELNFSEMEISFIRHFPHLTINLFNFSLKSSAPFSQDTLIIAGIVSVGVDLWSLVSGPVEITRIYIDHGRVVIQYNEEGTPNYQVYNASPDSVEDGDPSSKPGEPASGSAAIRIERIIFTHTDFVYSDPSIPLNIVAHGIDYRGKNDISNAIMRLDSKVLIDSIDLVYDQVPYIDAKPLYAELITRVDLNSLDMKFEKNDLKIKDVPFEFKGEFNFRKDGYEIFIAFFSMFREEYLSGSLWMISTDSLWVSVKADINVTLENWVKGFGIKETDLRGKFNMKLKAEGIYATGQNPESKQPDTVILSIPDFTITSKLSDGFFQDKSLPQAIKEISFSLSSSATNHDYRTINLQIENLKAGILNNHVEGFLSVHGLVDLPLEAKFLTHVNLTELKEAIPLDSLDLKGMLDLNLEVKGNYAPEKKRFPLATVTLTVNDGAIQTKYYPRPIEKIHLSATIINETGNLSGTTVKLDPLSFTFEGNPFDFRGDFSNPENLQYDLVSKGSIDLAGIYHLFSREGMELAGYISTDLILKGKQSDALAGYYDRLYNSGKLVLRNIALTTEYLPKPLIVQSGVFRFENDRIWFERFDSRYGVSDITMDGYLSNVINYVFAENQPLKGNFAFRSNYLLVDEFMASAETTSSPGVIVIPQNLEIGLTADLKKIRFQNLDITDLTSTVEIQKGMLLLKGMNFDLIGCKVNMEATYGSITPERAFFDFYIDAKDFDIQRAYREVELFRNLSTAAGKCEGIVSLNYSLKGKLNAGMNPVYPSLEGGGTLSLEKVKVMGLKLFNAMGKNLEKEGIKNPNLSKVDLRTTIKNNVITLERTKMKMAGFRFRIEGQTSFNGKLNLKSRLGLPPLGIVGIPMRILGTSENPKFKYGRGTHDEDVEETEYSDELPPEMLKLIRAAKEEELPGDTISPPH